MLRSVCFALALALGTAHCAPTPAAVAPVASSTAAAAPPEQARDAAWIMTTAGAPFARSTSSPALATAAPADVVVNASHARQTMTGFGGAFNEHGWEVMSLLSEAQRAEVLAALFGTDSGLRFNYGRVPIGASDYALDRYTLDESPGDYSMAKFSIERDEKHLIPFVKAALALRPDLKLWGSAWTPPTWMKTNGEFDSGAMKDDPKVYAAYALYLARFVESYRDKGIDISMVVPQNEPGQVTKYPSCDWTPAQYITFIRDHLAPTLKTRNLPTQIFVGTVNKADWDMLSVLRDPGTAAVISGAALQWNALAQMTPVHAAFPDLPLMQSETECGNNKRLPDYNPETPPNHFTYAAYTFRKLRDFIGQGAQSYMVWNMVLDEHGKNIDSVRPWPQNSPIVIDRTTRAVTYTPMYWVIKHFSSLVEPGARVVETTGAYADQIAFLNTDGTLVVELLNDTKSSVTVQVQAGAERHSLVLPAESVSSLVIPSAG